jgi:hypothetical protein
LITKKSKKIIAFRDGRWLSWVWSWNDWKVKQVCFLVCSEHSERSFGVKWWNKVESGWSLLNLMLIARVNLELTDSRFYSRVEILFWTVVITKRVELTCWISCSSWAVLLFKTTKLREWSETSELTLVKA